MLRIPFIVLILMFFQTSSWALGLGNIEVNSSIGEPLSASIKLFGANDKLDADCFKLRLQNEGVSSQPLPAIIKLKVLGDGSGLLNIETKQLFFDPILELLVISSCEDQIERHFTILLDPPINELNLVNNSSSSNIQTNSVNLVSEAIPNKNKVNKPKKKNKKSVSKNRAQPETPFRSASADLGNQQIISAGNPVSPSNIVSGVDRVIISGGSSSNANINTQSLALRLETRMTGVQSDETVGQVLELNDLSDDMTAMSNKLAHLESQITKLQQRNQYLESLHLEKGADVSNQTLTKKADNASNIIKADETSQTGFSWWYGLLFILIAICVVTAEWIRRRKQRFYLNEASESDDLWQPSATKLEEEGLLSQEHDGLERSIKSNYKPNAAFDVTEINEGILEQAEVFVAHGRSSLAITLLQDHLHDHPKTSPAPWLLLLSLLKRENDEDSYVKAAGQCRQYFNFYIPDFAEPVLDDHSSIEDYPNAKELLVNAWGSQEVIPVLDDLIYNRRNEARQGFDRNAYIDILLLRSIAQTQNLTDLSSITDIRAATSNVDEIKDIKTDSEGMQNDILEHINEDHDEHVFFGEDETSLVIEVDESLSEHESSLNKEKPLDFNLELPVSVDEKLLNTSVNNDPIATSNDDQSAQKPIDKSTPLDFNIEFKI